METKIYARIKCDMWCSEWLCVKKEYTYTHRPAGRRYPGMYACMGIYVWEYVYGTVWMEYMYRNMCMFETFFAWEKEENRGKNKIPKKHKKTRQ